jgi:hypothetical protein
MRQDKTVARILLILHVVHVAVAAPAVARRRSRSRGLDTRVGEADEFGRRVVARFVSFAAPRIGGVDESRSSIRLGGVGESVRTSI